MTELPGWLTRLAARIPDPESTRWKSAGHQQTLIKIAHEIRRRVPVEGERATNDEARRRRELIELAADACRREPPARHWFTLIAERSPLDPYPPFSGIWAESVEEAIISIVVWSTMFDGRHIAYAQPDDDGTMQDRATREMTAHQQAERKRAERRAREQSAPALFDL